LRTMTGFMIRCWKINLKCSLSVTLPN